jgi:glycosyltransferase involved in cell wall biosynthesis
MSSQIRVFQLITALQHGGAENMVVNLVRAIDDVEFTVGYMEDKEDLVSEIKAAGIPVKSFEEASRFDPQAFVRLRRFLKSESFDILHAHLPYAQTVGRLAALGTIDGVISTQHVIAENYHPITRATERLTQPIDDTTVAVSNGVERSFIGTAHPPNELGHSWCTIYNGIDVEEFKGNVDAVDRHEVRAKLELDPDAVTLLNVGRYVPVKNQRVLIRAIARADLKVNLLVVGDGPLKQELRSLAAELGVTNRVQITGHVPEIYPYYAVSDLFVSPSQEEGLPITLLEAMAAELPVLASDIPGSREVVDDGTTGILYPPGDSDALISGIEMLRDRDRRRSFGTAGHERVRRVFSVERMAASYEDLYNRVVAE